MFNTLESTDMLYVCFTMIKCAHYLKLHRKNIIGAHKGSCSPQMLSLSSKLSPQSSSPSQIQCLEMHFCTEQANWFQEQEESRKQT